MLKQELIPYFFFTVVAKSATLALEYDGNTRGFIAGQKVEARMLRVPGGKVHPKRGKAYRDAPCYQQIMNQEIEKPITYSKILANFGHGGSRKYSYYFILYWLARQI